MDALSTKEQQAKAYGIDLSLLEANLMRTPEERLMALERAIELVTELRRALKESEADRAESGSASR
jgi:hypothetical protein